MAEASFANDQAPESTMSKRWYISNDGKQRRGPFSDRQLKDLAVSGQLVPTDMVLREGSRIWVAASSIKGLFGSSKNSGPAGTKYPIAIPVALPAPLPVASPVLAPETQQVTHRRKRSVFVIGWGLAALVGFLTFGGVYILISGLLRTPISPLALFSGESSGDNGVEKNDCRIGVLLAEVDPSTIVPTQQLRIFVLAENTSDTRIVPFDFGGAQLTDEFENKYDAGSVMLQALRPKEFRIFVVGAPVPVDKAKQLSLELSIFMDGKYRFRMPIKREKVTYKTSETSDFFAGFDIPERVGEVQTEVTREVVFKRDDFQVWFARRDDAKRKQDRLILDLQLKFGAQK
jgi:GYF domain 2